MSTVHHDLLAPELLEALEALEAELAARDKHVRALSEEITNCIDAIKHRDRMLDSSGDRLIALSKEIDRLRLRPAAVPDGLAPVYQVWRPEDDFFWSWQDCDEEEYREAPAEKRRLLYAAPAPAGVPASWVDAARKAKTITADVCRAYPETAAAHINGLATLVLAAAQKEAK